MSFKQGTEHYNLPQYVADDIPSWQQDITEAFKKLDDTLYQVADQSNTTSGATENLSLQVGNLQTTVTKNTQDIGNNTTAIANMDANYKAADTSLSNRISANTANIAQHTQQISAINQQLEELQPEPIEQLKTDVEELQTQMGDTALTGIGDGTVTGAVKQTADRQGIETRVNPDDETQPQWRVAGSTGDWANFNKGGVILLGSFTNNDQNNVTLNIADKIPNYQSVTLNNIIMEITKQRYYCSQTGGGTPGSYEYVFEKNNNISYDNETGTINISNLYSTSGGTASLYMEKQIINFNIYYAEEING